MSYYVLEIYCDDENGGDYGLHQPVIGPFDDEQQAELFIETLGLGRHSEGFGGYSTCRIICDETATIPAKFLDEWLYSFGDRYEDNEIAAILATLGN